MRRIALLTLLLGFAAASSVAAQRRGAVRSPRTRVTAAAPAPITIPYQRFVLKNGLTLLVHEDNKAPIVAVKIWYIMGSKKEQLGLLTMAAQVWNFMLIC